MSVLSQWIKGIVSVIILASLMEMMVSQGSLQRFVRVIMGLMVTLLILNPLLNLLNQKDFLDHRLQDLGSDVKLSISATDIIARGKELSHSNQQWITEEFRARVNRQSEEYAQTVPGVGRARAFIEFAKAADGSLNGKIKRMQLVVSPAAQNTAGEGEEGMVQPVIIGVGIGDLSRPLAKTTGPTEEEKQRIRQELLRTFNNFYGLLPEQIEIEIGD